MNNTTQCASGLRHTALEDHELDSWIPLVKDVVSVLGIVGNIILSIVRMQSHLRNGFNKLLVALAIFDTLTLATGLMYSAMMRDKGQSINDIIDNFLSFPSIFLRI